MFQDLGLEAALDFEPVEESLLVFYSLTDCAPCDVLARALDEMLRTGQCRYRIGLVKLDKADKRAMGRAFLRGKSAFPRLELHRKGSPTRTMNGLPDFATHDDLLQYLQEFLAESAAPPPAAKPAAAASSAVPVKLYRSAITRSKDYGDITITQPRSTWILVAFLAIVVIAGFSFSMAASYSRVEVAPGIVVSTAPTADIVAHRPGVVTELRVKEGQHVQRGNVLAVVQLEQGDDLLDSPTRTSQRALVAQMKLVEQQLLIERSRGEAEDVRLAAMMHGLKLEQQQLEAQMELQRALVASACVGFDKLSEIVQQGLMSRFEYEKQRQSCLTQEQQLRMLQQRAAAAATQLSEQASQRRSAELDHDRTVAQLGVALQELSREQARLQSQQSYVMSAPISGRVTAVQTGVGKFTNGSSPMLTIVPESLLQANVFAPSRAIGFVRPGQVVRLQYAAFPAEQFGTFAGKVISVSKTVIAPTQVDAPLKLAEPVYQIVVALRDQAILMQGKPVPIQPGMALRASIVLNRQSFAGRIAEPFAHLFNRS